MKRKLITVLLRSAMLAAAPAVLVSGLLVADAQAQAAASSASQVVLSSSTRVLTTLEQRRPEFKSNPDALHQYVASEFNTIFDRDYAARLVLGIHGRGASDADVKLFADALAESLMSRYGSALLDFDTKLKVRVKSETALPGGRGVRVGSELIRSTGDPVPVDYLMRQVGGQWKLFDVMVEGVSFVQTFRTQFDAPLRQKSIAQVAADLRSGKMQVGGGQ
ncbi:MlaC/ttg2D family ABC transporter substrate-binding protein [Pseudoxanthomonas dokdonensis]|uniref:Organic solvent ABC transporter n=1 Tax=Pseudoxanthomonas dokdonensis TaxID=344882 RepID=A0A0R0CS07_9GAMM|nr:ABC transporter substrate-binding protein [Pseudoxanthomonas dokdonensis]KRG68481.1 organic solvent ABC transporter [Pseudoxanthomonas dokdonensis]